VRGEMKVKSVTPREAKQILP